MQNILNKRGRLIEKQYIIPFILLFFVSPVMALILLLFSLISIKGDIKWLYYTFFFCLAMWLGAINATKLPASDQIGYLRIFEHVPEAGFYNTIFKYNINGYTKDPFYGLITYISYYLFFGKASLFFCFLTVIMYMFHFMAVHQLFTRINAGKGTIVCGVLSLAFFTQYFNLTTHMIRQMLAMSIVIYAIILKVSYGKNRWFLLISAFLTHTSSGLLIALSILPVLSRKLSLVKLTVGLLCFASIVVFNIQIGIFMSNTTWGTVSYGFNRLAETNVEWTNISLSLTLLVICPLAFTCIKKLFFDKNVRLELYLPVYLFIFLMFFVFLFYKNPLIQHRFFFYTYSFIPLLLPLLVSKENKSSGLFYTAVSIFFIVRFFVTYDNMVWEYAPLSDILFFPLPYLLFHPYS
jgi:hypothetical protein